MNTSELKKLSVANTANLCPIFRVSTVKGAATF